MGKSLWQAGLAAMQRRGYHEVTLWVLDGNERALRFYEAAGFKADGVTRTEIWQDDLSILERRLTRLVEQDFENNRPSLTEARGCLKNTPTCA